MDCSWEGFNWLVADDNVNSVVAFERKNRAGETLVAICNFTPVERKGYRIGVNERAVLTVLLCSEDARYGGACSLAGQRIYTHKEPMHGKDHSFAVDLPGFSVTYLKYSPYKKTK